MNKKIINLLNKRLNRNFFKLFKKSLGIIFGGISLLYFFKILIKNFHLIPAFGLDYLSIIILLICFVLGLISSFLISFVWYFLALDSPHNLEKEKASIIYLITQFGKYLPGNVGQFIWRISMAKEQNIPIQISIWILFVEVAVTIFTSLCLVTSSIIFNKLLFFDAKFNVFLYLLVFISITAIIFRAHLIRFISNFRDENFFFNIRIKNLFICLLITFLYFLIMGEILKLMSDLFSTNHQLSSFEFATIYSIAWLLGTIIPGAPAGLGIRDVALVTFLSPIFGAGSALGISVGLRMLNLLVDLVCFISALFLKKAFY